MNPLRLATFALSWLGCSVVANAEITAEQRKFFENKIRPILAKKCYKCHAAGAKKNGGKLLLDTTAGLKKGGESGSLMVAGKPNDSLIVHALKWLDDLEMPPDEPLPENVVADFEKWILMGAPVPADKKKGTAKAPAVEPRKYKPGELWSFQPVKNPPIPETKSEWPRSTIDQFVFEKMAGNSLKPTADAPPNMLVRRLYFDLIGLPPTMAESDAFVADFEKRGQAAVEKLVDDLLASPHFGERWGRHWLDVARYAESNGNDGLSRNASFPNAWRYRDYVIDALNRDVPYDRFITEQIAGDLLEAKTDIERDRQLVATGFLALGAKPAKAMNTNFKMDIVADQIEVVTSGIIGLSVACARCHDHKFDPIPTRDYYALAGFFTSSETLYGIAANEKLTADPTPLHVLKTPPKVPPSADELKLMVDTEKLEMRNYPRPKKEHSYPPGTAVAMGIRDRKEPQNCKINLKGDAKKLGEAVPRGVLTAYPDKTLGDLTIDKSKSGRRELAQWLTDKKHPQTSRVMVNRVWQHLFGKAIIGTPDDFGVYGEKPSHPELLDHLASRFSGDHKWSIKSMIREIVLSRAYQLDSLASDESLDADPENTWVSRHTRRRLDAESIRDAILKVTGNLNPEPADGSPIRHLEILVNRAPNLHKPSDHRSIYLCFLRNSPPQELSAFDLPDGLKVTGKRNETMLPTQGLFLLNSDFIKNQADHLAKASNENVRAMWQSALNREPTETEIAGALYLVENTDPKEQGWSTLAQALLAANEFRYVD